MRLSSHSPAEAQPMTSFFRGPALITRAQRPGSHTPRLSLLRFEDRVVPAILQSLGAPAVHAVAGVPFNGLVAAYSDSDGQNAFFPENQPTATIDWGDGQTSQASLGST